MSTENDSEQDSFADTPEGWALRWGEELAAAEDEIRPWHKSGEECVKRYSDETEREGERLALYASGVNTREAMLFGNDPTVDVKRRNNDAHDDDARVAADILGRLLNGDMERDEEQFPRVLGNNLKDWLLPGGAFMRLRYVRETEQVEEQPAMQDEQGNETAPAVPATEQLVSEDVESVYVFWQDVRWSPCRTYDDLRWTAFRLRLSQDSAEKKFGVKLPLAVGGHSDDNTVPKTPWARAEVWEIWDKEHKCVWWYCKGHPSVLKPVDVDAEENGSIPDPLQLKNFWPHPEPLFSNLTTSKWLPRPDYAIAQDQFRAVDATTTRIGHLRDALKANFGFDSTQPELANIMEGDDEGIPVLNMAALNEKGGIEACFAWLPLESIVAALDKLRELRQEDIALLYQVTGDSDIMRGQATSPGTTATEQAIKAKFASVRGDISQKRFARFATEAQRIRGEIIRKHFDPKTIAERANVQGLEPEDLQRVPNALAILKSPKADFRISVKPESISLTDYAANKQEALDVVGMIGQFMQAVEPIAMQAPQLMPKLLELLAVFISRVKGGEAAEAVLDSIVQIAEQMAQQAAQQAQQGPPPDPKAQTEQIKLQAVGQKANAEEFKAKAGMVKTQLDLAAAKQHHEMDMQALEAQVRADALKAAHVETGGEA